MMESSESSLGRKESTSDGRPPHDIDADTALSLLGSFLDVRRFDMLVHAGPMDFRGHVHEVPNHDLDWNTTIFYTVTDPHLTARLKARFGQRPLWSDSVVKMACQAAKQLPSRQYQVPSAIRDFMAQECHDFRNEHADGSFTDHLDFCAEYTARYFHHPQASPNVLFLHSICGVNTNLFPLDFDKIPLLQELLTPQEYLHVQAFPTMLRLLFLDLLDTLWDVEPKKCQEQLQGITFHTFHGTQLSLLGDDLWIHLNYHLIHVLDFLPCQHFDRYIVNDPFVRLFVRLHQFLRRHNQLLAQVKLDRLATVPGLTASNHESEGETEPPSMLLPTWEHWISKVNAQEVAKSHAQFAIQMRKYSDAIHHNLAYQIHWK
jgi:hypothetical protein